MSVSSETDSAQVVTATELAAQTRLLHALVAQSRSELIEIGISDGQAQELTLDHFPATGSKRVLVRRTGNGFDALAVPTTGVLVLAANEARLGCSLVNTGANPILLYLSDAKRSGVPAVWLAASGGSWDGRFGNMTWAGNVFAVAQTGASTLAGGEL